MPDFGTYFSRATNLEQQSRRAHRNMKHTPRTIYILYWGLKPKSRLSQQQRLPPLAHN